MRPTDRSAPLRCAVLAGGARGLQPQKRPVVSGILPAVCLGSPGAFNPPGTARFYVPALHPAGSPSAQLLELQSIGACATNCLLLLFPFRVKPPWSTKPISCRIALHFLKILHHECNVIIIIYPSGVWVLCYAHKAFYFLTPEWGTLGG